MAGCCFSTRALCIISLSVTTDCCLKLINKASQMDRCAHAQSVSSALLRADIWVMPVFYHDSWDFVFWNHQTVIKSNRWRLSFAFTANLNIIFLFNQHFLWGHCMEGRFTNLQAGYKGQKPPAFPPALAMLPGQTTLMSPVTSQTFYKSAEWPWWSINTEPIAPARQSSHIRDGKKPEATGSPRVL